MDYEVKVEARKDNDGKTYWAAYFPKVNSVVGGGDTPGEAIKEAYENLDIYLDYLKDEKLLNYIEYDDKVAFHPGYYLTEIMNDEGISINEFVKELDIDENTLRQLLSGKKDIDMNIAEKLSISFGTSKEMWINLQSAYDKVIKIKM